MPRTLGFPDLVNSTNVIGYSKYNDDYYVHLGPGDTSFIQTTTQAPAKLPYLIQANARVSAFNRHEKGIDLVFEGYTPLKFTLANMNACALWSGKEKIAHHSQTGEANYYELTGGAKNDFSIRCE